MSVTVSAVPFMLIFALGRGIVDVTGAIASGLFSRTDKLHLEGDELEEIFQHEFDTVIVDKKVLLKTLREHGATNFEEEPDGTISCDCEAFRFTFHKRSENQPYTMTVAYNKAHNPVQIAQDIGSEYALNAQEISYNKIKERLAQQNLQISEEEVFDDNTIVLTVDLN